MKAVRDHGVYLTEGFDRKTWKMAPAFNLYHHFVCKIGFSPVHHDLTYI